MTPPAPAARSAATAKVVDDDHRICVSPDQFSAVIQPAPAKEVYQQAMLASGREGMVEARIRWM
jgi:hypothetical protein